MRIAAIVLAAGASRRLGRPKQTLVLGAETLLERSVRIAKQAGLVPLIVVLRAGGGLQGSLSGSDCMFVTNSESSEGLASSIRCGITKAIELRADGVVLMSCDQIALSAKHVGQLCDSPDRVTGSRYGGKTGVPAYFPASSFAALLELSGDAGAQGLLLNAEAIFNESLTLDIDTEEDVERATKYLAGAEQV